MRITSMLRVLVYLDHLCVLILVTTSPIGVNKLLWTNYEAERFWAEQFVSHSSI